MNTQELINAVLKRLKRFKIIILLGGIVAGMLMFMYARRQPVVYTFKSTLFPISTSQDNNSASNRISELIGNGGGGSAKNLSDEASVSIEEVGKSKKTREAVVSQRLPEYGNKMIAEIFINEYNKNRSFSTAEMEIPKSDSDLISIGGALMAGKYIVKFNKTGLLEISCSGTDSKLLTPLNYILIEKVSLFYKELKTEKAKADYEFIQAKFDSFETVINKYDKERIRLNQTTLFVPPDRLQFLIPKENLDNDKLRVIAQKNNAAANREEALWRLQKVTPVIKLLDKPFLEKAEKPSSTTYGAIGFIAASLLLTVLFIFGLLYRFTKKQVELAILPKPVDPNTSITA